VLHASGPDRTHAQALDTLRTIGLTKLPANWN
jgi:hypothetical protein